MWEACSSPFGSKMDRRSYFRGLVSTPKGDESSGKALVPNGTCFRAYDGDDHGTLSDRRSYLRQIVGKSESSKGDLALAEVSEKVQESDSVHQTLATVCFDLKRLRQLKAAMLQTESNKTAPFRKRPNYNNSRRRLLANPKVRVKWLVVQSNTLLCGDVVVLMMIADDGDVGSSS